MFMRIEKEALLIVTHFREPGISQVLQADRCSAAGTIQGDGVTLLAQCAFQKCWLAALFPGVVLRLFNG